MIWIALVLRKKEVYKGNKVENNLFDWKWQKTWDPKKEGA